MNISTYHEYLIKTQMYESENGMYFKKDIVHLSFFSTKKEMEF